MALGVLLGTGCGRDCHSFIPVFDLPDIEARVVDRETKQPIEGVVALAIWTIDGLWMGSNADVLVREAVSDNDGRFRVEGWSKLRLWSHPTGTMNAPDVVFLKRGYEPVFTPTTYKRHFVDRCEFQADIAGKVVEMSISIGGPCEEPWGRIVNVLDSLVWRTRPCSWRSLPVFTRTVSALVVEQGLRDNPMQCADGARILRSLETFSARAGCSWPAQIEVPSLEGRP